MASSWIETANTQLPMAERRRLGRLTISSGWHGRSGLPQQGAELLIPHGHSLSMRQGNLDQILRPPLDMLVVMASGRPLQTSTFQGWRVGFDQEQLCLVAAELSGHRLSPGRCRRRLQSHRLLQPREQPQRELAGRLRQQLQLADGWTGDSHPLLALVGLEQQIERTLVLLLCGDLILSAREEAQAIRGSKARIIEELLSWIEAHLNGAIQLEDLVAQSGYSQRSLRNIFHERFGCGPVQWIRQQRLQRARRLLLEPEGQATVSGVATACGYDHLSQFSRDFRSLYGVRPSELLREGRRCSSGAG